LPCFAFAETDTVLPLALAGSLGRDLLILAAPLELTKFPLSFFNATSFRAFFPRANACNFMEAFSRCILNSPKLLGTGGVGLVRIGLNIAESDEAFSCGVEASIFVDT
jgi:uncharacterized membrane protein YqgA involved in biofilm formation